ncbi:2-amino-4-hydroxy-6-hydroxymethyldihydropteridine diphosphokinase [Thiocystis violacea]|uniref:2-amino-4-hydroxy-6- hydroxymethyldihydropteridine diphosphokinase n=1 Tax=Thiocystis violacea TaxID=13725 RepID=UPI001908E1F6|nr:2-amino-4-hydroxy-6-hydroxymethyldihydropteridine diphosphokinase [Thiocystis violacea]MBK1720125.1 2-amino-4-hydroxy-6-hydroxymethyldihydropteridine diphosphokinase [Thiocystis violacea]
MSRRIQTFVAVGSNIHPEDRIPRCLDLLGTIPETEVEAISSWYRTRPWGLETQPDFINLVVGLGTGLSPRDLLRATQAIEIRLGRVREAINGPRTIDLDILLFGDWISEEADLRIPHPGLLLRDFMLIPLVEIAPDVPHPDRGRPVRELTGEIRYRQIIEKRPGTGSGSGSG